MKLEFQLRKHRIKNVRNDFIQLVDQVVHLALTDQLALGEGSGQQRLIEELKITISTGRRFGKKNTGSANHLNARFE